MEDELKLNLRELTSTKDDVHNIDQFRALDWWCKQRQRSRDLTCIVTRLISSPY